MREEVGPVLLKIDASAHALLVIGLLTKLVEPEVLRRRPQRVPHGCYNSNYVCFHAVKIHGMVSHQAELVDLAFCTIMRMMKPSRPTMHSATITLILQFRQYSILSSVYAFL